MTWTAKNPEQDRVVATEAALTVVLGGAGVGKTTSALAAAAAHIERVEDARPYERVLFLSFSRASVARIATRTSEVLGRHADRVDVMTFHSLAFSVVRRFGALVGHGDAVLVSPAREKLGLAPNEIGYGRLIPLALEIARTTSAVAAHLRSRWGLVIVDEFQDTGDAQQELLEAISPNSRMILLGDPNQCIYTFLAADGVRLERISEACSAAGEENTILLPETSFRDPSGVIPSIANAVRTRNFGAPALESAINDGRLVVHSGISLSDEGTRVAEIVTELAADGLGVAVFTHHNDMLASLSDALETEGIEHEIAGLSDALAAALDAQATMMRFRFNEATWNDVLQSLAVFLTSSQRGPRVPLLARQVLSGTVPNSLLDRIESLRSRLSEATSVEAVMSEAREAHQALGLPQKSGAWQQAGVLLSVMNARVARSARGLSNAQIVGSICAEAREASYSALTESTLNAREVQLMNLYQTKGREADATVVVLREGDFLGSEAEPFPNTSRLLYVVFSRARQRIIVLLVGGRLHPAVAPLARLSTA